MVEELIAAGWTPAQVEALLVKNYRMSPSDAALMVQTALGGTGDVVILEEVPDAVEG